MKFCKTAEMKNIQKINTSQGSNVERDKEADKTEERALQGEDNDRKDRKLPLLHIQSTRLFHKSLE